MRALFYDGTMSMTVRQAEEPVPVASEVLVEIANCGICGSDMHAYHGHDARRVPPMILGHEAVGTVLDGEMAGKRVAVNPLLPCGNCPACRRGDVHLCASRDLVGMYHAGAFADRLAIPESNLTVISDSLDFQTAALAEPLACGVHAVRKGFEKLGMAPADTRVAVLGGGAIGMLAAMVFASQKVRELWIAETNPLRRELLEASTGAKAYDPRESGPEEVDMVLDAVGTGITRAAASEIVAPSGMIVHIGLQDNEPGLDTRRLTLQEIGFMGVYCYQPADFAQSISMLENEIVTLGPWAEVRPLEAGPQSFDDIHHGRAPAKIILSMS